jgi:CheY-like chemotaxis protein
MKALIVEPDTVLARQYQKAFTAGGVDTVVVGDAQQAVIAVDANRPNVVIIELQLAGHSGVEFLHEFRSYEDWADIPVIVHSSVPEYAVGADPKIWQQFGVVRYFYKPKTTLQQLIGAAKTVASEK